MGDQDPYIGLHPFDNYRITKKVGEGKIGSVYTAIRKAPSEDVLACKVISEDKLKDGWERELEKVVLLRQVENIVQYHAHGSGLNNHSRPYVWVLWDYVRGVNLSQFIEDPNWYLDLAFIEDIGKTILRVLHACRVVGIQHGDLHDGNVLISDPDSRIPGSPRRIWISDFGYGGSHNKLDPRDDYRQLFAIISNLLGKLEIADLNPRDKVLHSKMSEFLRKKLLEVDPTQGRFVGDPEKLLDSFEALSSEAEREASAATTGEKTVGPGDYLWAEALGLRVDEWKNLFVPEFLAPQELLSRNITVLTGARGCGKTMAFRRVTAFMDKVIGEPSGVKGADQFVGFYLNCRDFVEVFPWLPKNLSRGMQQHIIHYFHLAWFSEICKTLALYATDTHDTFEWLNDLLLPTFNDRFHPLPAGADVLAHTRAFLEIEKENSRVTDLGIKSGLDNWPLARLDFLDTLQMLLEEHVSWIGSKPIYLFLDDFTIPIVTRSVQRVLNPMIFKRRSKLFFKVSTESSTSFERKGLRDKPLELHQDFELLDLATESLHQTANSKKLFLENVFKPRIERISHLADKGLSLTDLLGKMPQSNNALAKQMRAKATKPGGKRIYYSGVEAFVGMWASDIRIMIQMFTDMLRDADEQLRQGKCPINRNTQDQTFRATGGEFLQFIGSVVDPSLWDEGPSSTKPGEQYGTHLIDIVEAFVNVSRYELTKGALIRNQGRENPKQAFRLEVIDKFELNEDATRYFEGIIRWHIFLQDWRGKSVRGMITPRMYLNRILLPFSYLTFSSHDNIHLKNEELILLLTQPTSFFDYWVKKRKERKVPKSQQPQLPWNDFSKESKGS